MNHEWRRFLIPMCCAILCLGVIGCGSSSKESGGDPGVAPPTRVGSDTCANSCHAATQDITGTVISVAWSNTTHTTSGGVQCEDCHGAGSLHFGLGPIPFPNPQAEQCNVCHGFTAFNSTRHANGNGVPNAEFTQIATPVSQGRHIEECSVCHNVNQRFVFDSSGNLQKPRPDSLPRPVVNCASCHDAHQPQQKVAIPQRTAPVGYPIYRKFVQDSTGAQSTTGTSQAAFIYQPNGAVQANGTLDPTKVVGKNNELTVDLLCAACHTKGLYKNSGGVTHQPDIHTQWTRSGHGNRNAPAFAEFSANPAAYTNPSTGLPYEDLSHTTSYPVDMAISRFAATGPANTTQNAGNNNFACFKCHNGLTSLAYQDNVEGTAAAPVVFGDSTVTCLTCHDPHTDVSGQTKNTRRPLVMTKYTSTQVTFSGNVFLDNTPVPAETGNATICVFCHQGRESGFTLFKRRLAADSTLSGNFLNEHYLGTAAMLWARNAYEYAGKQYGQVARHQQTNCIGCHMIQTGSNDLGGHSWNMFNQATGAFNNSACNTADCHNGRVPATRTAFFGFRDSIFDPTNDYDGDGALEGIPQEIEGLSSQVISLLASNGIEYDDLAYPYFFKPGLPHTNANAFTAWTLPTLKAAFNLQFVIKGLPSSAVSQVGQPNPSAAAHNYRYNIQLLRDSYDDLWVNAPSGRGTNPDRRAQARPAGTRPATNYDPQSGGAYNPRQ